MFPPNVKAKCESGCPDFPVFLSINTDEMTEEQGLMSLKYFVPASDIPISEVKLICNG